MKRRTLLSSTIVAVVSVAGCAEETNRGMTDDGAGNADANGDAGGNDGGAGGETGTPTDRPRPDIVFEEPSLITVESGYYAGPAGEVAVRNDGDAPSGVLIIFFDWLDENGEYIETSSLPVQTLAHDETMIARRRPLTVNDSERIEDVRISHDGGQEPAEGLHPDGVELVEDELHVSEEEVRVRGLALNNRDSEMEYLAAVAKVYDTDNRVLAIDHTDETDIGAGDNWRFEISKLDTVGRNGKVESSRVILSEKQITFYR